jgi:hypothetical protein
MYGAAAQSSVLSSGDWWRLRAEGTGMYRVTVADVPGLQGAAVGSIGLYGAGGGQLSTYNRETPTADLQPVAIDVRDANGNGVFDAADAVLFFGEGADVWRYDGSDMRWELRRHAYARANYYYLTTAAAAPLRIAPVASASADTVLRHYTAVAAVNNDLVNIFGTGQTWLGEKFTATVASRTFTLSLPATATDIKLRYALASHSSATGVFSVRTQGLSVSHSISSAMVYGTWLEATNAAVRDLTFTIGYSAGEGTAEGYLDFIEMSGRVPLSFGGGQLVVRDVRGGGQVAAYAAEGASGSMRVWDVSDAGRERELATADGMWSDSTGGARQYVLFDGSSFLSPAGVERVKNQDLHGNGPVDYVIVCNGTFKGVASRLASLHEVMDNVSATVVTDEEVYNEFSSGKQDPMAIRSYMRWLRNRWPDAPPRWLLLMGKATYDPKDIEGRGLPTVATYETPFSFDEEGVSFCSDDFMGYLDEDEHGSSSESLDIAVGRLPAKSVAEATHMVDKIEGYMTRRDLTEGSGRGDWRNYVALLADDADPSRVGDTAFASSSEKTADRIKERFPRLNIDRLYADAYRQQSGAIGSYYPDLNNALRKRMDYGCLLLNYVGHGSLKYIGTERYIEPSDLAAYANKDRLPMLVASTCSYGWHDKTDEESGAELCLLADGGMVAVVSAARPISHTERFNTDLVVNALDPANTIGDALRMAKNRTSVSPSIGLTGDPALRLSVPSNRVVVTEIDGRAIDTAVADTATALSVVTVRGEVQNAEGALLTDFDGMIYPIVFDRETWSSTLANDNPGAEVRFRQQKSIFYKGSERVSGGVFEYSFTVPKDVPYEYDFGKLSHYAVSGSEDASGYYGNILFGGLNEDAGIYETRPEIRLFMGDTNFRSGGLTGENPTLVALLSDKVGINAFGSGLGHDITATLDGGTGKLVVLNDFYEQDVEDSRKGTVRYSFSGLEPGVHALTLKVWNIWGYSNSATILFRVRGEDTVCFSKLRAYPNPAKEYATLHYETNGVAAIESAVLQIYSSHGALVHTCTPTLSEGSFVVGPVRWDLSGVAPGIYMARMLVTTKDGETHQAATKVVVR